MEKLFGDTVYDFCCISPECVNIIDTPAFQRLRRIKQLGPVEYVFPSAVHTRFEHSIGSCHIAGSIVDAIWRNQPALDITQRERQLVRIAALCHDIGHGPFSHSFEVVTQGCGDSFEHESASCTIFEDHIVSESGLDLDSDDVRCVKRMIKPTLLDTQGERGFLYQLVCNPLNGVDVDKMDYLVRDAFYTNIASPKFLELHNLRVVEESGSSLLALRDKSIGMTIDFLEQRANMHRRVYKHRVVVAADLMITDALQLSAECLGFRDAVHELFNGQPDSFLALDDHVLTTIRREALSRHTSNSVKEAFGILNCLARRRLYELVYDRSIVHRGFAFTKENAKELTCAQISLELGSDFCNSLRFQTFRLGWGKTGTGVFPKLVFFDRNGSIVDPALSQPRLIEPISKSFDDTRQVIYTTRSNSTEDIIRQLAKL